jgi:hypothetical protein
MKNLGYVDSRIAVTWRCHGSDCNLNTMQILDWGVIELQRKVGLEKAREKVESISDLNRYALKFFLGNLHNHPTAFTIVGLWYPARQAPSLF